MGPVTTKQAGQSTRYTPTLLHHETDQDKDRQCTSKKTQHPRTTNRKRNQQQCINNDRASLRIPLSTCIEHMH
jgi:hypothetical protein